MVPEHVGGVKQVVPEHVGGVKRVVPEPVVAVGEAEAEAGRCSKAPRLLEEEAAPGPEGRAGENRGGEAHEEVGASLVG